MQFKLDDIKFIVFLLALLSLTQSNAQEIAITPLGFNQFPNYGVFYNPSQLHQTDSSNTELNLGYRGFSGIRKNIRQNYFCFSKKLKSDSLQSKHFLGLHISNEAIGKFFRTIRTYADYKIKIQLERHTFLSIGTSIGFYNFNVIGNEYTAGLSSFALDGNFGANLRYNKFEIGASMLQAFNSKVSAQIEQSYLKRHYHFYSSYNYNYQLWDFYFYTNDLYVQEYQNEFNFGVKAFRKSYAGFQVNCSLQDGIDTALLLEQVKVKNNKIDLVFNYNLIAFRQNGLNSNHFEICLKYYK